MKAYSPALHRSPRALSALIGFIVLFAALSAGLTFVESAWEKVYAPTWLGSQSGVAMNGFLLGAEFKATKTVKNPYPDVMPAIQSINHTFVSGHIRLISWLVLLGEGLVPIALLVTLCISFRGSRQASLVLVALAAAMNLVYMLEGSSGENTPMLFMWLTVLWLLATLPAAALSHSVELRRGTNPDDNAFVPLDTSMGQWVFFGSILLVIGFGNWLMYPVVTFGMLVVATILLTGALRALARMMTKSEEPLVSPVPSVQG